MAKHKYILWRTWRGCYIERVTAGEKHSVYLRGIYGGRASWICDYARARFYKTADGAEAVIARLEQGEA